MDADPSVTRAKRGFYAVSLVVALAATVAMGWWAKSYEELFGRLGFRVLPTPTNVVLAIGWAVRSPMGLIALLAGALLLSALAARGTMDRMLNRLILANGLWIVIFPIFAYLSLRIPVRMIEERLREK